MTKSSLKAFVNESNTQRRRSTKFFILKYLKDYHNESFTYEEISNNVSNLNNNVNNTQKRCSDLYMEGKINIVGQRNGKSLYQIAEESLFPTKRYSAIHTLKEIVKDHVSEIDYNLIINQFKACR